MSENYMDLMQEQTEAARSSFDWEAHRYGPPVACDFTPRLTWDGAQQRAGIGALAGKMLLLKVMWLMDESDKYPGEYALAAADEETEKMFRAVPVVWIASGDVTPLSCYQQPPMASP